MILMKIKMTMKKTMRVLMYIMVRMIRTRRVKMMMMMMVMTMMTMTVMIARMKMMMMMKIRERRRVKMMMTSFLDELWMTSLKLLRSVANSVFHLSYLRCRPPRTAYLDKKECRSIATHRSRSY